MEDPTLVPLQGKDAIEKMISDFMHLLLDSGISTEETLKQGFVFAQEIYSSLQIEEHYYHDPAVDCKLHASLALRQASRMLGIDLQSQRSSSEKQ